MRYRSYLLFGNVEIQYKYISRHGHENKSLKRALPPPHYCFLLREKSKLQLYSVMLKRKKINLLIK